MFGKNVGGIDKILRIALGALLVLGALLGYGWLDVDRRGAFGDRPIEQLPDLFPAGDFHLFGEKVTKSPGQTARRGAGAFAYRQIT